MSHLPYLFTLILSQHWWEWFTTITHLINTVVSSETHAMVYWSKLIIGHLHCWAYSLFLSAEEIRKTVTAAAAVLDRAWSARVFCNFKECWHTSKLNGFFFYPCSTSAMSHELYLNGICVIVLTNSLSDMQTNGSDFLSPLGSRLHRGRNKRPGENDDDVFAESVCLQLN